MMAAAQIENIQADTGLKKAETINKEGGERELLGANTEKAKAETKNTNTIEALNQVEKSLKELAESDLKLTRQERLNKIVNDAKITGKQLKIIENDAEISQETKEATIKEARAKAAGAVIQNQAMAMGIKLDAAKISEISNSIAQGWQGLNIAKGHLSNEQRKTEIDKIYKKFGMTLEAAGFKREGLKGLFDMMTTVQNTMAGQLTSGAGVIKAIK